MYSFSFWKIHLSSSLFIHLFQNAYQMVTTCKAVDQTNIPCPQEQKNIQARVGGGGDEY